MLLLVSPKDKKEAIEAYSGGADIIDIKNPKEGSLGASFPWLIRDIISSIPAHVKTSATVGDVPYKPGTVSFAALGVAVTGVNFVKVGLYGTKNKDQSLEVMKSVVRSVKDFNEEINVVTAGYGDAFRVGAVDPLEIPSIAIESGSDVAMVDTAIKDGKSLFDFMSVKELYDFVDEAKSGGLMVALAGSLGKGDIPLLKKLKPDIIGIRGAVCTGGDRDNGRITRDEVKKFLELIRD
ncbi:MAG: (5-formylfuran-3-yl)methyl phosphate synthase [Candidatus Hydrothermarchaeota archaeon]